MLFLVCCPGRHGRCDPGLTIDSYFSLTAGLAKVFYRSPDSATASNYLHWIVSFAPRGEIFPGERLGIVSLIIAPDEKEFQRLSGGALPEWGVAFALPEQDLVIMRSPRIITEWLEQPRTVLNHELSHIFLDQRLRPAAIPRWFQEGYALWNAEMWGLEDMFETSVALALGSFMPLRELRDGFPLSETLARRAYLQSYTVVDYLASNWNSRQLDLLFERWRETGELDNALRFSLGLTLDKFESNWHEWAGVRYGWLRLLGSATLLWIIAAGLFILVFVYRRRRYKNEIDKMRRIENRYRLSGPWALPLKEWTSPRGRKAVRRKNEDSLEE